MRDYQDGSQEEYWGEKEIAELRELNVAAFREIAYLKNQKESLRELNAELLEELEALIPILERAGRPIVAEGVRQRTAEAKEKALK